MQYKKLASLSSQAFGLTRLGLKWFTKALPRFRFCHGRQERSPHSPAFHIVETLGLIGKNATHD